MLKKWCSNFFRCVFFLEMGEGGGEHWKEDKPTFIKNFIWALPNVAQPTRIRRANTYIYIYYIIIYICMQKNIRAPDLDKPTIRISYIFFVEVPGVPRILPQALRFWCSKLRWCVWWQHGPAIHGDWCGSLDWRNGMKVSHSNNSHNPY